MCCTTTSIVVGASTSVIRGLRVLVEGAATSFVISIHFVSKVKNRNDYLRSEDAEWIN